jgi:hypothetical protein
MSSLAIVDVFVLAENRLLREALARFLLPENPWQEFDSHRPEK